MHIHAQSYGFDQLRQMEPAGSAVKDGQSAAAPASAQQDAVTVSLSPGGAGDLLAAKVDALRGMVATGTYRVGSAELATRLIDHLTNR